MVFGWKKKKLSFDIEQVKSSKIPILTLDKLWHNLFPPERKSRSILSLEKQLGNLIKEQGKLTNEHKEYINLKKKMMDQIMKLTTDAFDHEKQDAKTEMDKTQKYILEINQKLEDIEERLQELPEEIQRVNSYLLEETVNDCYYRMKQSRNTLEELNQSIEFLRNELKEKLQEKNIHEEQVEHLYSYLHHLVGAEIIEKLDKDHWR